MKNKTICIATLLVPSVVYTTASDCRAGELLREIQTEQCKLPYVTQNQVMQNVFKNYNNLNVEVKNTLDILWNNDAGNLLLRRLHNVIKNDTQKLTILWNAYDEEGGTNLIRYDNLTIYLNTRKFGQCIGYRNGELCALPETLDDVLFHEMTHGLHKLIGLENTGKQDTIHHLHAIPNFGKLYKKSLDAWTDDEEVHTITGLYLGKDEKLHFDCLNTNSYMVLKALKNGTSLSRITQRLFHYSYDSIKEITELRRKNIKNIVIKKEKYLDIKI